MSDYPKEELEQLQDMYTRLRAHWEDGNTWEFEAPPALLDAAAGVLDKALRHRDATVDETTFEFMVTYGQVMFSFGQFTHAQGLYRANLTPASFVDDDELAKMLGDG